MNPELQAALARAHEAGLCVLPAAVDGSKRPSLPWKRFQAERPTHDEIILWAGGVDADGIGYVCGAVSGNLEMLELEGRAVAAGLAGRLGGHDLINRIARGYCEATPSGGLHLLYRCTEPVDGNLKLASRVNADGEIEVLIETRGEGGWTVAAPSGGRTHPNGASWAMVSGGVESIVTITADERRQLLEIARSFDELPKSPHIETSRSVPISGHADDEKPGHRFNRSTTWAGILEPAGWRVDHVEGEETYWTRPGKDEGVSATTNYEGTDLLKVFSTSTPFRTDKTYDRFGAWAVLNGHGDDLSAAARALVPERPAMPLAALLEPRSAPVVSSGVDDEWRGPVPADLVADFERDWSLEEWLIWPFLIRGGSHALYARAKTGKSLFVLNALSSLAAGREFLGRELEPATVGYFDYEMGRRDVVGRWQKMGFGAQDLVDRMRYFYFPPLPPLNLDAGGELLLKTIERYRLQVVVIDTVSRAIQGDENESGPIQDLYRSTISRIRERQDVTILRIDHAGKKSEQGQRGSSAKDDDVDAVIELSASGDLRILTTKFQRPGYMPDRTVTRQLDEPLRYELAGERAMTGPERIAARLDAAKAPLEVTKAAVREWWKVNGNGQPLGSEADISVALKLRQRRAAEASVGALLETIADVPGSGTDENRTGPYRAYRETVCPDGGMF